MQYTQKYLLGLIVQPLFAIYLRIFVDVPKI